MKRLATALCLAMAATVAQADETWSTQMGTMIWETDQDDNAIWLLQDQLAGRTIRFVVPGLAADMMGGRGSYHGVWIADKGDIHCDTAMVDPLGQASTRWGTFVITFVNDRFPSDWAGVMGACLETPTTPLSGVAP